MRSSKQPSPLLTFQRVKWTSCACISTLLLAGSTLLVENLWSQERQDTGLLNQQDLSVGFDVSTCDFNPTIVVNF